MTIVGMLERLELVDGGSNVGKDAMNDNCVVLPYCYCYYYYFIAD